MKLEDVEGIGPATPGSSPRRGSASTDDLLAAGRQAGGPHRPSRRPRASISALDPRVGQPRRPDAHQGRRLGVLRPARGRGRRFAGGARADATRRNLAMTFQEVVAARPGIVRRVPSETEVAGWIDQSKKPPQGRRALRPEAPMGGFKEFLTKSNALALAIGVIIGAALGAVVNSLVNDIIMPPIGWPWAASTSRRSRRSSARRRRARRSRSAGACSSTR